MISIKDGNPYTHLHVLFKSKVYDGRRELWEALYRPMTSRRLKGCVLLLQILKILPKWILIRHINKRW